MLMIALHLLLGLITPGSALARARHVEAPVTAAQNRMTRVCQV